MKKKNSFLTGFGVEVALATVVWIFTYGLLGNLFLGYRFSLPGGGLVEGIVLAWILPYVGTPLVVAIGRKNLRSYEYLFGVVVGGLLVLGLFWLFILGAM